MKRIWIVIPSEARDLGSCLHPSVLLPQATTKVPSLGMTSVADYIRKRSGQSVPGERVYCPNSPSSDALNSR